MELYFLGTGAGMPSKQRNVTSIALNLLDERGTYWLFDCGEGTQHQIMHSPVKLGRTEILFVTHLHGDHLYGLPGLLTSRSYVGGDTPLKMFGPKGLKRFVETALDVSGAHLGYTLTIEELEQEGVIFEDDKFIVETARLEHRIECFGYRITEKDLPGKLMMDKLKELGVPAGPLYGKLKQGEQVELPDGRKLNGQDFVGAPLPGRVVVILGDTRYCEGAKRLARGADVLVHEATFSQAKQDLAYAFDHATSIDAARVAEEAGAKSLIMTHLSSRYQGDDVEELLLEAKAIHGDSYIAKDLWSFEIHRKMS
ncbi:ribonuclease Z [Paenibacillus oryzisoli]|uniref:ribonuclease Z n=1 Tax=Paenibacillus oryzisoli TaxID=1850517 RepID=UPI003D2E37B0